MANAPGPGSHPYTFGIEEEYFLVRRNGRRLRHMPRRFFDECRQVLGERFGSEMLQTQVEVRTDVHDDPARARADLHGLRTGVATVARRHGLAIFSAGTHPSAQWREQRGTDKPRYDRVIRALQLPGRRNLLCGLHVHVQPAHTDGRVPLMARLQPFLPLLLALSTSSPFWVGHPTGLMGYRQTAYQEIPRTGLPPLFRDRAEYERYVHRLVVSGAIEDTSHLWWAMRPSHAFPTLELRVPDACTDLRDALAIAQLFRCLVRHLERRPALHASLGSADQAVVAENLWRAQRHGFDAGLIDLGSQRLVPVKEMLHNTVDALQPDIDALHGAQDIERIWAIVAGGSSAHRQLRIYDEQRRDGWTREQALQAVIAWLAEASVPA